MQLLTLEEAVETFFDHRGKTPRKLGGDFTQSGVPVASAMLVADGVLNLQDCRYVSPEMASRWMPEATRRHDVLLTSEAPLGRVALIPTDEPLVLGQRLFGLRGRSGVMDSRFLYYALTSAPVQKDLEGRSTGTTVLGIRQSALRRVRVPAPPLPEQQAIAEVLGALDDKITANRALVETSANLRLAHVTRQQASAESTSLLSDLATTLTRGSSPRYSDNDADLWVINQKCVREGRVSLNAARHSSRDVTAERELRWGDVLVNSTGMGTLGRVGIWTEDIRATVDSHLSIVRFADSQTPVIRAHQMLLTEDFITSLGEGSTGQTELSRALLGSVQLADVDPADTGALEAQLTDLLKNEQNTLRESSTLASVRDTLLPALMDGSIRVKDAIQTAEAVL